LVKGVRVKKVDLNPLDPFGVHGLQMRTLPEGALRDLSLLKEILD
jgi:hypothetical protein